ncbi:hypothetical protein FLAG1_05960 [Fusarium langsethiae]|uniref:Uncharacterized protein n=1 Tax=Fusarium langsethiae TaxID=179993 RepID=A0A0N1J2P1_FUSLA|nr:hypothetical protein FLAG1_05960 [Fusarium langsethiae]GKU03564.1 unnamed protein product [Fusarium langsethiae]
MSLIEQPSALRFVISISHSGGFKSIFFLASLSNLAATHTCQNCRCLNRWYRNYTPVLVNDKRSPVTSNGPMPKYANDDDKVSYPDLGIFPKWSPGFKDASDEITSVFTQCFRSIHRNTKNLYSQTHRYLHRRVENKCPTCRRRLHYIPCKCPHVLGVLLEVEEAKRQEMLDKIDRIKSICDRCFACGLKIIAWKMKLELNPFNGVEVEEDDSEMQFQMTLMPPDVKMIFKRTGNYGEWGIKAIRVENRRYAPYDLDLEIHRLLDRFVNQMAEIYFTNRLISGEGIVRIAAEISVAEREYSLIEFEHS